jgi:hypothetical protein
MKKIVLCTAVLAAALPMAASAALYRCGSAYQDRPCEGGVPQETLRPSGARNNAPSAAPSSGTGASPLRPPTPALPGERTVESRRHCTAQGEQAERIVWKRQGGASREMQVAELGDQRGSIEGQQTERLITRVYASSGSASEIRAQVEARCLDQAPLARRERRDAAGCQQLREVRQTAEIRSRTAGTQRQVELHRQNLKELDDRLVNEGCT